MSDTTQQEHITWILQNDIHSFMDSDYVNINKHECSWFPAYSSLKGENFSLTFFSALVPISKIDHVIQRQPGWGLHIGDGAPAILTSWKEGKETKTYQPIGSNSGAEPIIFHRQFHGIREDIVELSQEFCLFNKLYPEPGRRQYIQINEDGDESKAVYYDKDSYFIRTDLILNFCAIKEMALAIYIDSRRFSKSTLEDLGLKEANSDYKNPKKNYNFCIVKEQKAFGEDTNTYSRIVGAKYIMPVQIPEEKKENYQDFIIGSDALGNSIKFSCDPSKLSDIFDKNPKTPRYLTPVFFRSEVLTKYYNNPKKYCVADGHLSCGYLWGLDIDNDHEDYVMVYLGDLGQSLSESERNYWLSFNIVPNGRSISETSYKRNFMVQFTDPQKVDLVFKSEYNAFNREFPAALGWNFFIPLHENDQHFLIGLKIPEENNYAEFDLQLIALTKILVDSINEAQVFKSLASLEPDDKSIRKLEKFFIENSFKGFEKHINFLKVLQGLRSTSAAHRKGTNYENLIESLKLEDKGTQKVFIDLLKDGIQFIQYLKANLVPAQIEKIKK